MFRFAIAAAAVAVLVGAPTGMAARTVCGDYEAGRAYFTNVAVVRVPCAVAERLLSRATLTRVRRGRAEWTYAGWRWRAWRVDESLDIQGRRGRALIYAGWYTI